MSWITWLAWITVAILAVPVAAFLGGFTYRIIEEICKAISKSFIKKSPVPIQAITQPIRAITQPIPVEPFAPYNRIRGYFPSDN